MSALGKISGGEPMLAVNLGTRGVPEAIELLEYANHPGGTELSERRAAAGARRPFLHAAALIDDAGELTVFAVNRSRHEALPLNVELRGLDHLSTVLDHSVLADEDPDAQNTLQDPERVAPRSIEGTAFDAGTRTLTATLPPLSWNVIRLG
jgi:alpha-L-arabinofuranosidase